jgi:hypothetical protein
VDGTNQVVEQLFQVFDASFELYQVGQRSFQGRRCSFQVENTSVSRQISQSSGGCQVSGYAANEGGV